MKVTRLLSICTIAAVAAVWTASLLMMGTSGCASRLPAMILVQNKTVSAATTNRESDLGLKLVTYNVWGLPSWMTGAAGGRYMRIAQELQRLDPDIILLQEAWTADARKSAPANDRWMTARAVGQKVFFQQNGLVTLSKFPILGGKFYPFSRAAFPDCFVNKGILKVTVQLSGGRVLNIWNVHLQDGGPVEIRKSQVSELVSRVEVADDGRIADLIGGDFNCTPDSPGYRELETKLGPSVEKLSGSQPFVTWDGLSAKAGIGQTLDYLFIRRRTISLSLQASQHVAFAPSNKEQRLSDHFGIEAIVNLSTTPDLVDALDRFKVMATGSFTAHRVTVAGN